MSRRILSAPRVLEREARYALAGVRARIGETSPSETDRPEPEGQVAVVIPSAGGTGPDGRPLLAGALELVRGLAPVRVVITNGQMSEASIDLCRSESAEITHVTSPGGFNFSRAVNAGVRAASANRILLLNDDISGPAERDALLWWLSQPAELSGVALRWPSGRIAYGGVRWGSPGETPSHRYAGRPRRLLPRAPRTLAVTGAAMLFNRELFDRVGGFCEELPLNYGDIDFCVQALGYGVTPRQFNCLVLTHRESATRGSSRPSADELRVFERRCGPTLARHGVRVSADRALGLR